MRVAVRRLVLVFQNFLGICSFTYADSALGVADFNIREIEPDTYTLYGHAAVQVLKQAPEIALSFESPKIASALHSGGSSNTVLGSMSFNHKEDSTAIKYVIYSWS